MDGMRVVESARAWLGVPYHHQGRSKTGVDCIGLLIKVAHDLNLSDYDYTAYKETPDGKTLMLEASRMLSRIPASKAIPGDLYVMRFRQDPQHFAIKTDTGIIHALRGSGKVIETGIGEKWKSRIVAAFRFKGVNNG